MTSTTITRATRIGRAARAVAVRNGRLDSRAQAAIALCLYLGLAIFRHWPWITDPADIIYGVVGGDQTASIAQFQHDADSLPAAIPARPPART